MRVLPLLLLALAGCGEKPEEGDTSPTGDAGGAPDTDGDGVPDDEDCDPEDQNVYPGHWEIPYNGIDDDCAGGDVTDYDGDGYDGVDVEGGTDCNDGNPDVNPGAVERCYNEEDEDCDGVWSSSWDCDGDGYEQSYDCWDDASEEPFEGATEAGLTPADVNPGVQDTWYDGWDTNCDGADDFDQDADGETRDLDGGVDCDDTDAAVNTSAEEAYDLRDNDCDAAIDVLTNRTTNASWYGDSYIEEAYFGYAFSTLPDLSGDGVRDVIVGVPGAVKFTGRAYVLGWDEGLGVPASEALATIDGSGTDYLGWATASLADGGGNPLVAVGAAGASAAYVFTADQLGGGAALGGGDAHTTISYDYVGWMMTTWRDDTGLDHLVTNNYADGSNELLTGVFPADLLAAGGSLNEANARWATSGTFEPLDLHPVGDLDGDGIQDLGIAFSNSFGPRATVAFGDEILSGAAPQASGFGDMVGAVTYGGAADVNGDGLDDLFVSDPEAETTVTAGGVVWIVSGSVVGAQGPIADYAFASISGVEESGQVRAARSQGDLDGDGVLDLLVCAPGDGTAMMRGTCRVLQTADVGAGGDHTLPDSEPRFSSVNYSDQYGWLSVVEDADADGDMDLWVSGIGGAGGLYSYVRD